jgi:hypothetical protein
MKFKLTYHFGNKVVQEWSFHSKALAYWYKSELMWSGRYNDGKFKVSPI